MKRRSTRWLALLALSASPCIPACQESATERSPSATPRAPASTEASAAPSASAHPAASAALTNAVKKAPTAVAAQGPSQPLNVLLILVDSLRADMPWARYPRDIAPNLTKLESESVSYTRHYSVSSYTAKSVAALLSGKYPTSLYRSAPFFTHYPDSNLFLAELLKEKGVITLSAQAHMYMRRGNGLDQGFVSWETVPGITFDAQTDNHVTSQKLTPLAIELLGKVTAEQRFFMYLHYMDPHDQYIQHKDTPTFGSKPRDRYDSEVLYTDRWIGTLLDYCRAQSWWQHTAVVVSADHGEAFGEHGATRHAFHLWDVLTHVPLFVRLPGVEGRRIDTPRSSIDLAPTFLDLMKVETETDFAGKSLARELYGAEVPTPRPVLLDLPADTNNPELRGFIDGPYKLLVYGRDASFELYNLENDPAEKVNLAKKEPEVLARMKAKYQETWGPLSKQKPYGGQKLTSGAMATGPMRPPKK